MVKAGQSSARKRECEKNYFPEKKRIGNGSTNAILTETKKARRAEGQFQREETKADRGSVKEQKEKGEYFKRPRKKQENKPCRGEERKINNVLLRQLRGLKKSQNPTAVAQ